MNHYKFETSHFGISEEGLHLLRNKFNYQTLSFQDIHSAAIKRGVESKNWLALLITGLVLLGLAHIVHTPPIKNLQILKPR